MPREDDDFAAWSDHTRLLGSCVNGAALLVRADALAPVAVLVGPGVVSVGFDTFAWVARRASIGRLAAVTGATPGWAPAADLAAAPDGAANPPPGITYRLGTDLAPDVRLVAIANRQEDDEPDAPSGGRTTSTGGLVVPLLDIATWIRGLDPRLRVGSVALYDTGTELRASVSIRAGDHARSALALVGACDIEMDIADDPPSLFGWVRLPSGHDVEVCVPAQT
jgi:hypothetical protein